MIVLEGKKSININKNEFASKLAGYNSIYIDIGTGQGSFIYKRAKENPEAFYLGLDAAVDNMVENAKKILKKPEKGGLKNVLYIVSSIENPPSELENIADHLYVNLPWGSLLEGVVKGGEDVMSKITFIAKNNASLKITTTYSVFHEEGEIAKRGLPELNNNYFENELSHLYNKFGIDINSINTLTCEDLKGFESQWAKKLAYGKQREIFGLECVVRKG